MNIKKIAILCVCCAVLVGLFYWVNPNSGTNLPAETTKRDLAAKAGETFAITLEENATTGYTWNWETDGDQIVLVKEENTEPEDDKRVGTPTMKTWTFQAKTSGTYIITFTYQRSWETDSEPVKTEIFTVTVE